MSVQTNITIPRDTATSAVAMFNQTMHPDQIQARVGPAVAGLTRNYLRGLPSNKKGWPTTNFWQRASRAVSWIATSLGVLVRINQVGVKQRYHGGRISPVRRRALTIPISPEAYGKTVSDFPGAFLIKTKRGAFIVQRGEGLNARGNVVQSRGRGFASKRVVAALEFLFKLSPGVNQRGDPTVLPPDEAYFVTAHQAIKSGIARINRGGAT